MSAKVCKVFVVLVVIGIALLMGNILLTGRQDTKAAPSSGDSQAIQVKTCSAESTQSCCEARNEAQCCPTNCCSQSCCEAKKEAGTCPAKDDPKACPDKCPQCCCPKCCCTDCCCPKANDAKVCPVENPKPCCPVI